ncbi:LysM peptidoglycan-binding domain-containing protein [Psychroserpens sp. AS72]|uniref:LysM peptidoglycan-binding domain-containing protein n=1 Tax=Psychroserpens sp. AS72 TaxID=3135775 RepID=UPI00316D6843
MLKNFKLITSVILVTASSLGAVAQTETHKDVILDGKAAKLNVKTGEVILVGAEKVTTKDSIIKKVVKTKSNDEAKTSTSVNDKKIVKGKSEIEANLLTNANFNKVKSSDASQPIYTSRPDTLVNYYKNKKALVTTDEVMMSQDVYITTDSDSINSTKANGTTKMSDSELLKIKEKATAMVYEVSEPTTYKDNTSNFHKVIKGETLYALSKRYNTTLGDLKKANNLETTLIKIGQVLRIKNFDSYNFEQTSGDWTVSKGDTLYNIAKRNNTTVASLKSLNGLESNLIIIGQTLRLK